MLYTIAEAAKAMGLEESLILKAIEDGQITGTKNVSGEWHVDDEQLNLLYLLLARDYCKRQWQADLRTNDGRSREPEIANFGDDYEGRVEQERTETRTGAEQAEAGPSIAASASTSHEFRIDDRDRISASDSRSAFRANRVRFITATVLLALGCIGALSSFYFFGRIQVPDRNANSSGPVLGSEKASIPVTALEPRSGEENIINLASAGAKNLSQTRNSPRSINSQPVGSERDSATSHTADKGQVKAVRKLVPVPETKPTTIPGWTVRNVVNGIATLEGPGGTWKAVRGDTVPGLGTIDSVVLWGNRWIVATSKGLITTP
jgi:hypothetical protein